MTHELWTLWIVLTVPGMPDTVSPLETFKTKAACREMLVYVKAEMKKEYPDIQAEYYCLPQGKKT